MKTSTTTLRKLVLVSTALFFSLFNHTIAQITINGTITDPDLNPINNALVEIFDQNDTLKNYNTTTDASGYFSISNITDIKNLEYNIPDDYLFIRNYPNPFNPSTIIYFEITKAENIEIKIFDILGRKTRTLFSGFHDTGVDQINWDGKNNFNQTVSAGVYLCQLKTKDHFKVHKMVLLDGGTGSSGSFSYNKISNQNIQKPTKVNSIFNFTVKVTGDSLDATYFRNLTCKNDTTLNLIVSKIIKTETIGIEGGIVGNDDFMISIPAGAFNGNYDISLIKIEDDGAFGENTVTPSFKVSGIPSNYSKPLKIVAKYSGELSGESYLGLGEKAIDIIEESSSLVYNLYEASDSLGYLVSTFPASISTNVLLKNNEDYILDFFPVFATRYAVTNSDHFKFVFPLTAIQHIQNLKEMFEDAYSVVENGLQILIDEEIGRLVIVKPNNKPITTNFTTNTVNGEEQLINIFNINQNSLTNDEYYSLQVKATQELFLFTGKPEAYYYYEEKIFWGINWITLAIYCWIEDLVNGDPDYKYPQKFLQEGMESFNGFHKDFDKDENPIHHGRGMSAVIKYLTNKDPLRLAFIGNFYKNIKSPGTFFKDFLESINFPLNEWWPEYFKEFVNNELYKLPDDYFINKAHEEWNINSVEDVSKTFTSAVVGKYQDLSAKMFKINLNYSGFENTQKLSLLMDGPNNNQGLSLILFSIKDNKVEYIGTSNEVGAEIQDLKGYYDLGVKQFLAILVNSNIIQEDYLGKSEITLEMSVTPKIEPLNYKRCKVVAQVLADVERKYHNGTIETTKEIINEGSSGNYGTFEGNTFTSEILSDSSQMILNVLLNETQDTIIHFEWSRIINYTDQYNTVLNQSISGKNIPINLTDKTIYEIQGSYTCNYLNTFKYEYTYGDAYIKIPTFICDLESYIFLQFFEE